MSYFNVERGNVWKFSIARGNIWKFVVSSSDASVSAYIIIQSGQSNALGATGTNLDPTPSRLPESYKGEQEDIKIWYEGDYLTYDPLTGEFVNMNPVSNTEHYEYTDPENVLHDIVGWSTEQEISHRFLDDYDEVYVIKNAYSANDIAKWDSPNGVRWVELNRYITRALEYFAANDFTPVFLGMVWMQGEADIANETVQATYQSKLETLISNVRGLSGYLTDLKIYLCKIPTDYWGDETVANTSFINVAAADENAEYIDTSAYAVGYEGLPRFGHYTAQNLLDFGGDLYNEMTGVSPTYPAVLDDGNTDGWYDYKELLTLVDGVDGVSIWGDKTSNGNDLLQADTNKQPSLNVNGILFDGSDDFLQATFTLVQPTQIYMVFKQVTYTANDSIITGKSANCYFYQSATTPDVRLFMGALGDVNGEVTIDTYKIVRVLMSGVSSSIIVNETTPVIDNAGTNPMDGLTVGGRYNGTNPGNIEVKEIIVRKIADSAQDEQDIYDYLEAKYSIS